MHGVVHDHVSAVKRHLDADRVGLAGIDPGLCLCRVDVPAGALVSLEGVLALLCLALVLCELLGRAEAVVGVAGFHEILCSLAVEIHAVGLLVGAEVAADLGTFVPVKPQPLHGAEDDLGVLLGGAGRIGVVDPQDERAMVGTGEGPVEDCGAGAADMELAGGRGREAHTDGTVLICHRIASRQGPDWAHMYMVSAFSIDARDASTSTSCFRASPRASG